MPEEEEVAVAEEEPGKKKKKKGKLPIIIALVLVLAGGGFFMMKGKGGPKGPPPLKLGIVEPMMEFLVNLREPNSYLRAEVSLHLKEGYTKEMFDKNLAAVRDAVILTLGSCSIQQIRTLDGKLKLKKDVVAAINTVLEAAEPEHKEPHGEEKPKVEAKTSTKKDPKAKDPMAKDAAKDPKAKDAAKRSLNGHKKVEKPKAPEHPDWDSQTGPVLKLYFTSFATQ